MSQYQIATLLVVLAGARTGDCRVVTGPEGLCAFGHLEPARIELHVGSTLQIRVNGSTCSGRDCVDCGSSVRLRWRSTVPDVASVDSTGLVRARRAGTAQILLEPIDGGTGSSSSMRVEVLPLVETDLFEHREVKGHFINPCCFGEDFARWLRG